MEPYPSTASCKRLTTDCAWQSHCSTTEQGLSAHKNIHAGALLQPWQEPDNAQAELTFPAYQSWASGGRLAASAPAGQQARLVAESLSICCAWPVSGGAVLRAYITA